jgi:glucose-1-phosphate thymidylyltransferase
MLILVITTPHDAPQFQRLRGSQFGISITFTERLEPNGLAQAFVLGADFIGRESRALVLGDNIFYGLASVAGLSDFTTSTGPRSCLPRRESWDAYGVVEFDEQGRALSLEESRQARAATSRCRVSAPMTTTWSPSPET